MATNLPLQNWAFIQANDNFIMQLDYDGSNNLIYQGFAQPGSATSEAVWRIRKYTYNATPLLTSITFPQVNGSPSGAFSFVWDNRSSYSYS